MLLEIVQLSNSVHHISQFQGSWPQSVNLLGRPWY